MIATCTELATYRQGLSNLARLSGFEVTASTRAATEQRVNEARAAGVPESLIISAILIPQNAWEESAANLIDIVIPQELIRIQGAFQGGGACASGQGDASSGIVIPDLGLAAFSIPAPPPLPSVASLGGLAASGTTTVQAPPVAVAPAQGGTVSGTEASTTKSLAQTTRPVLEVLPGGVVAVTGGEMLTGLPGVTQPVNGPRETRDPVSEAVEGGLVTGGGAGIIGTSLTGSLGIGFAIVALVVLVALLSPKE